MEYAYSSVDAHRHHDIIFEAHRFAAGDEEAFPLHAREEYQFYVSMSTPSSRNFPILPPPH